MNGFELAYKLGFERMAGSERELEAANIIKDLVDGTLESFEIPFSKISESRLEIDDKEYNIKGFHLSGNIDINGEIVVVDSIDAIDYLELKNKIALLPMRLTYDLYEKLAKKDVKAIIASYGSLYDDLDKTDLEECILRPRHLEHGKIPCFSIRSIDANEILRNKKFNCHLILKQEEVTLESHNVISVIKGELEEEICFTAHYDSVRFSKGIYDNATGSGTIYDIYNYYKDKLPKYTLRFIWCGAEERGLLGSKAYTNIHKEELKKILLNINVDMTGVLLGFDLARVSGDIDLANYISSYSKEVCFPIEVKQGVYSSDSTPFADNEVPAVSFARCSYAGGCQIHSNKDNGLYLDLEYFNRTTYFIIGLINKLNNSKLYPVKREVPEKIKEEIKKYYGIKVKA